MLSSLPALEQGLRPLGAWALRPSLEEAHHPEGLKSLLCRLLLRAGEQASLHLSSALLPRLPSQDARRELALILRADAQQLSFFGLPPMAEAQELLLLSQLTLSAAAALAQLAEPGSLRQALDFVLPELLDELYRLSNAAFVLENQPALSLLPGFSEIMPGRPLLACHRHPYDEIKEPLSKPSCFEKLALMLLLSLLTQKEQALNHAACFCPDEEARALCMELSLLAHQHLLHFHSLRPALSPLEEISLSQQLECWLYASCCQMEGAPALREEYKRELLHEQAHLRKAQSWLRKEKEAPLPSLPPPLLLGPHKGYIRDCLQAIGTTSLREKYVPVGTLPVGADFFRYQRRVCPDIQKAPSHRIIERAIKKTGSDYRFEIAPHPVEALRDRAQDQTQVGR